MNKIKIEIYDELSRVLTDYEECTATGHDLYNMLVRIQNSWDLITEGE
ncbi:MAG: hypothetical protein K2P14_10380 [Anaeroplasmataceae bacterium]|nr:hypothetical protein [Anaeroplasmataceae bacterium]